MMEKKFSTSLLSLAFVFAALPMQAQVNAADSVMNHAGGHRLSVGGYGEAAYSRNFYSDNVYRYSRASQYKNDPSHGRFDIPHAVIYLGYDFGKGWTMGSEIEFEHTAPLVGRAGIRGERRMGDRNREGRRGGTGAVLAAEELCTLGQHPRRTYRRTCGTAQRPPRATQLLHRLSPARRVHHSALDLA